MFMWKFNALPLLFNALLQYGASSQSFSSARDGELEIYEIY
jgi:hypothetical protein